MPLFRTIQLLVLVVFLSCESRASSDGQSARSFDSRKTEEVFEREYILGAALAHVHKRRQGYGSQRSAEMHKHLLSVGFESVQLNTFAYQKKVDDLSLNWSSDSSLKKEDLVNEIRGLKEAGFKVFLKPHVWVGGWEIEDGQWRNQIDFPDAERRAAWFSSYGQFIEEHAKIAQDEGVEFLAVGTELAGLIKYDKEWSSLISKVRKVYKGKITYAAEVWSVPKVNFWGLLDYIGVDAYYTLSEKDHPSVAELVSGYRTEIGAANKPWEWSTDKPRSELVQANIFEASKRAFSKVEFLEGVYIWKYFTDNNSYEKANIPKGFTPYGKQAESVIRTW